MSGYALISDIYDIWQESNSPAKWAEYTQKIIDRHCKLKGGDGKDNSMLLLDLGCGTGGVSIAMSEMGYEVIAMDYSQDMLSAAGQKEKAEKIQFICSDITSFELYGTADIMICFLDTLNHILSENKLDRFFALCKNYLNPGGLLIFDMATQHYFETVLGNRTFYDIRDKHAVIWQNTYNKKSRRNNAELTFFLESENGLYRRGEELIKEKSHSFEIVEMLIKKNKLAIKGQYDEFSFRKPKKTSERVFFVVENSKDDFKLELQKNKERDDNNEG